MFSFDQFLISHLMLVHTADLQVSEQQVSQTIPRGGPRSQIAIPAQGMIEFRDALTELLEEFGTDDQGKSAQSNSLVSR